jgi:hypothetical protein
MVDKNFKKSQSSRASRASTQGPARARDGKCPVLDGLNRPSRARERGCGKAVRSERRREARPRWRYVPIGLARGIERVGCLLLRALAEARRISLNGVQTERESVSVSASS